VTAYSRIESDAIIRLLLVEPEGIEQTLSQSSLITGQGKRTWTLDVPELIVPKSFHGVISLSGDLMSPAVKSLGSTLRMPYGCGEQNMVNFAPAVLIKKYLTAVRKLTSKVDIKASHYMNVGYQRQLTYQRSDGSYAVWGESSYSGSTW
jgi:CD109 antigen